MRVVHYILGGVLVALALAVSVVLILRDFPTGARLAKQDRTLQQVPPAEHSETNTASGDAVDAKPSSSPGHRAPEPGLKIPEVEQFDPTNVRLNPTAEQTERLRYVLLSHNIMQSEAPEFPLRIGGKVPDNVTLMPMPREIADVIPEYAHYSYVMTQYQIVIAVTKRREIDLLIPIPAG